MTPIARAIAALGGPTAAAKTLDAKVTQVCNWVSRDQCPAQMVLAVEAATKGLVSRYELRPDVFGEAPVSLDSAA